MPSWFFTWVIITDQRLIWRRGGLSLEEKIIPVQAVQEINFARRTFWGWLLRFGTIEVAAANMATTTLRGIAHPERFVNLVMRTRTAVAAPAAPSAELDPDLAALLDGLTQLDPLPPYPTPDRALTVKWPLQRALSFPLEPEETIIAIINRHWWSLARRELAPLAMLLSTAIITSLTALMGGGWQQPIIPGMALGGLGIGLLAGLMTYLNFVDDRFVLTNRRVLDINRRFFIFAERVKLINTTDVQETTVRERNPWEKLLGYGTVIIAVAGNGSPLVLDHIPSAEKAANLFTQVGVMLKKRDAVQTANRARAERKAWTGALLGEMVLTVPELRGLALDDAIVCAAEAGLRLTVLGESRAIPGLAAGIVITQSPFPEARALRSSDIAVMLSRR